MWRTLASGSLALCAISGCTLDPIDGSGRSRYSGPEHVDIGSGAVRVALDLAPFHFAVADDKGAVRFQSVSAVSGELGRIGPLGATHRSTTFDVSIIEGWDHTETRDDAWLASTAVADAHWTRDAATLELFDPAHPTTTFLVDISVVGSEVRFDAAIADQGAHPDPESDNGTTALLNQIGQAFAIADDQHFYGLGERYVSVDHRGRNYGCWVEEGGVALGEKAPPGPHNPSPNGPGMTHAPVPFLLSSTGWGLWVETAARTGFSLGDEDPHALRVEVAEPSLHWHLFVRDAPAEALADYTAQSGRAFLPAPWVFGPRRRVDRGEMIDGEPTAQALRDHGVPTTAMDDATHFLPIASEVGDEDSIAAYNAAAHDLGFKSIAYYNAYVSVYDPRAADLYSEGKQRGYFVHLADGSEFDTFMVSAGPQTVATIDMINRDAASWYGGLLGRALDLGYDGWMLDFGEYLPQRASLANGTTGWEGHNAFPVIYQRTVLDALRQARGDDFLFFARSGYVGSQALVPVLWSGDPSASFDDAKGLPAQVRAAVNAGLSGFPYWGSDVSGYSCNADPPADKEVYLRWAEFGALSTDMHDENACAQGPAGQTKWTLWSDAETTEVYGDYARLHTRMFPYLYAAADEATRTGMPIMRHPLLMHPSAGAAASVELEYYFGPALYVAPVVRRGQTSRSLWLPPGTWVDWWTLGRIAGDAMVTRDAPLATLPLYQRAGTIVALLDASIETLAPESSPAVVGPADVAGMLDARAVVTEGGGARAALVDGTVLDASESGPAALPAGVSEATDEATLATCSLCGRIDPLAAGAVRLRVTGASTSDASLTAGGVTLRHHAPAPLRVRWDVVVLP